MQVRVNVDEIVELEYNSGAVKIQVRVLPWEERKAHVLAMVEALPPGTGDDFDPNDKALRKAIIEMRDAVAKEAICGWSGMKDIKGNEVPFDANLIGRLEPYDTIADDAMEKAMAGFDEKQIARAVRDANQESTEEKN